MNATFAQLITDLQRQLNRVKGTGALSFELISLLIADLAKLRQRVERLEEKENNK